MLKQEWRNVDFAGGEVRLAAGTTKNREGRVFYSRCVYGRCSRQHVEHERLRKAGQVETGVFFRMVAEGRRGPKKPQPIRR